jgi:hypothetical protein
MLSLMNIILKTKNPNNYNKNNNNNSSARARQVLLLHWQLAEFQDLS